MLKYTQVPSYFIRTTIYTICYFVAVYCCSCWFVHTTTTLYNIILFRCMSLEARKKCIILFFFRFIFHLLVDFSWKIKAFVVIFSLCFHVWLLICFACFCFLFFFVVVFYYYSVDLFIIPTYYFYIVCPTHSKSSFQFFFLAFHCARVNI